jgi:hypothetical protein
MTDASDEVKVGVWRALFALGSYRFTEVIWPEVFFAAVIAPAPAAAGGPGVRWRRFRRRGLVDHPR